MRPALVLVVLSFFAVPSRADEPAAEPKKDPVEAPDKPAKPAEPARKKPADGSLLDPELQKELRELIYGPDDKKKEDDPLESAIRGMRSAKEKIAGKETGQETRDVQKKVIEDLQKLIEQAQSQKPPPSSSSQSNQNQKNENKPKDPSGEGKTPQNDQSPSEGSGNAGQKEESSKARESNDQNRAAQQREAEMARRRDFIKDVWGHLPPKLRDKLLNIADEKSVPRYDEIVRRYFESLAEEGTREKLK